MAASFVAAGTPTVGTATSITPALPAGIQAGDLLICHIGNSNETATIDTIPSGWATPDAGTGLAVTGSHHSWIFTKVAGASETDPTFSGTGSGTGSGAVIEAWRDVDSTTPVHRFGEGANPVAQTTVTTPTITPTINDCVIAAFFDADLAAAGSWTADVTNERYDANLTATNVCLGGYDEVQSVAAGVSKTGTTTEALRHGSHILAIAPSGAPAWPPAGAGPVLHSVVSPLRLA